MIRTLPHIIGSQEWLEDDLVGLREEEDNGNNMVKSYPCIIFKYKLTMKTYNYHKPIFLII